MNPFSKTSSGMKRGIWFLAVMALLYFIGFYWLPIFFDIGFFLATLLIPFSLGALAQMVLDPDVEKPLGQVLGITVLLTFLLLSFLLVFGLEAIICIAIGAPIMLPAELLGIWIARLVLRDRRGADGSGKLNASLIVIPLLIVPLEGVLVYPQSFTSVVTKITIDAPVDVVWQNTVVIPTIKNEERIWTVSHNLLGAPQPVSAAVSGNVRDLRWTDGVRFQEIITERVENQRLAWDFSFHNPDSLASFDPHILPNSAYLNVSDGFYELTELADGQTLLTLESHYMVRSPLNGYLNLWGKLFLNDFQTSVLNVIKSRSEGAI